MSFETTTLWDRMPVYYKTSTIVVQSSLEINFASQTTRRNGGNSKLPILLHVRSQSIRNQESTVRPDHRSSERKDLVQDDASRRSPEHDDRSSVRKRGNEGHLEENQEYMLRGKEYLV